MPDKVEKSLHESLNEVRAWLEDLRALGLDSLPVADLRELPSCPSGVVGLDRGGPSSCRQETLDEVRHDLGECQRCPLCKSRSQIVFGSGSATARILFVGGAPTRGDDSSGEPLAGELFTRMLFAMGMDRSSVYACQIVMCGPVQRSLRDEEIATCLPFLQRQIEVVAPLVIVAMGEVASRVLTGQSDDFKKIRGHWFKYQGIDILPTFDPAYLLLHPQEKREAWNDLKEVLRRVRQDD